MNILITGANGQLGRTFMDVAQGCGHKFYFTSKSGCPGISALDVTDVLALDEFMKTHSIEVIINCAGYTNVPGAETEYGKAWLQNSVAVRDLANAAKEYEAVLIHFSTDYVFDGQSDKPYRETDSPKPLSVYGETKLDGDREIMESGCRYLIFRTSWLYSCHGKNFFKTIQAKASSSPGISVVSDQVGTPTYAVDLARSVMRIIDDGQLEKTGLYNYSNEGSCSWFEFADAISRGFGYKCDVTPCSTDDYPSNVARPPYSVLDKSLFRETFGYEIPHWRDSLAECMDEYRKADSGSSRE